MPWYDATANVLERGKIYTHDELVDRLRDTKPGLTGSGYHWAISSMAQDGLLTRKGRGEYSLSDGTPLQRYDPLYSDKANELMNLISNKYPYVLFTVFETVLMNDFLNQLIAQNTIFVQVEKESSIYVFQFLRENGYGNIMYRPGKKDFNLYWSKDCIVVSDLISETPVRSDKPHSVMLEKMLVDMCADKIIASTFSKSELPEVFEQARSRYMLDRTRMMRYARRRNREDEIKKYIGSE